MAWTGESRLFQQLERLRLGMDLFSWRRKIGIAPELSGFFLDEEITWAGYGGVCFGVEHGRTWDRFSGPNQPLGLWYFYDL